MLTVSDIPRMFILRCVKTHGGAVCSFVFYRQSVSRSSRCDKKIKATGSRDEYFLKASRIKSELSLRASFLGCLFEEKNNCKVSGCFFENTYWLYKYCSGSLAGTFVHLFFSAIGKFVPFSPASSPAFFRIAGGFLKAFSGTNRRCRVSEESYKNDFQN